MREIKQIYFNDNQMVALCWDGTLWIYYPSYYLGHTSDGKLGSETKSYWEKLPEIPQDENDATE